MELFGVFFTIFIQLNLQSLENIDWNSGGPKFLVYRSIRSLAAHRFGLVEFWILNVCCWYLQASAVEKIKTDIQNLTRSNRWAAKDITIKLCYFKICYTLLCSCKLSPYLHRNSWNPLTPSWFPSMIVCYVNFARQALLPTLTTYSVKPQL